MTIHHPAEYVMEKIKKHGISCLLLPHCCTPAWKTDPACYVLRKKKIKDAWDEVKTAFRCENFKLTAQEAFAKWFVNTINPIPGFNIIEGGPGLAELLGLYVAAAYDVAESIPPAYSTELNQLAAEGSFIFTKTNVENARWLRSSHDLAKPLWGGTYGLKGFDAITYYNLIIVDDAVLQASYCYGLQKFAHELVHVNQYNLLGWENFLSLYITSCAALSYKGTPIETMAKQVEDSVSARCRASHPELASFRDNRRLQIEELINDLRKRGELYLDEEGEILQMSSSAEQELAALIKEQ